VTRGSDLELTLERVKLLERLLVVSSDSAQELELLFSIRRALERIVGKEVAA